MKNTGLCSVTFRNKTAEEIIALAVENRLACIEWGGDIHVPLGEVEIAKKIGALTRGSGLKTLSYGSYYKCRKEQDHIGVLECAKALEAGIVRIWSGEKSSKETTKEEYDELVQNVRKIADVAQKNAQIVAFEYHGGTFTDCPESTLKLLSDVGYHNVRCYFQPDYWTKYESEATRENSNLSALKKLAKYIVGIHVYAWRGWERFPLENDKEEWRQYLKNSNALFYNLEFVKDDSEAQFAKDAATLNELCN